MAKAMFRRSTLVISAACFALCWASSVETAAGRNVIDAAPRGEYSRYRLTLPGAGQHDADLVLDFHARDGRAVNTATHDVDPSGLRIQQGRVNGVLKVTIQGADGWPPGERSVECAFDIGATLKEANVSGKFSGHYGIQHPVSGALRGQILSGDQLEREFHRPAAKANTGKHALKQQPPENDWPAANGPEGNYNPRRYGHALVDDLAQARLAWTSEENDLGYGKGTASGYVSILAKRPGHPGSCSGPIVAGGMVFCTSFRPSGKVWAENLPHLKNLTTPFTGEELVQLKQNLRIEADDLLVALDQHTGQTVWRAVEAGKGLNRYMGKRQGFCVSPAYDDGRVFSMGTSGRLYAYEAATGKKLWEGHIGKAHQAAEQHKQKCLKSRTLAGGMGWDASLVVADGVLAVPLFDSGSDIGLSGVDPQTGNTLWDVAAATSKYATPAVFRHGRREYLLLANLKGEMRMIDPRDGKVLWTVTGLQPTYFSLSPSKTHVLVNVGSRVKEPGKDIPWGLLGAYRVSPERAEHAWTMPDRKESWFENHMDICAMRRVLIRDGLVYFFAQNKVDGRFQGLSILRESTGQVLLTSREIAGSSMMYLIEDRLLHVVDASHSDRMTLELFTADPANFRRLCEPWKPPQSTTTAYEVFMELPYVDGCFFMRTQQGGIRCYDLRRESSP